MMEIVIAVGIGAWFTLSVVLACVALFKSFKDATKEEKDE